MFPRLLALILTTASIPALAQTPPATPVCTATATPPAELAAWVHPAPLDAGGEAAKAPVLSIGKAADVALRSTPEVHYALRPEKPGGSVSYGGLLALDVARAGTYRIALSTPAWIDVVGAAGALPSTAHGPGPDCTGIRKMVNFVLTPGRYTLQISANGAPQMTVLVAPVPEK